MNLTVRTDLALRMLLVLAAHPGAEIPTSQMASDFDVSLFHMQKIGKDLAKLGWVVGSRGRHGGLRLACEPSSLRLDDVVRALEPAFALVACFEDDAHVEPHRPACRLDGTCRLRSTLEEALGAFFAVLAQQTIADLARDPTPLGLVSLARLKRS